MKKTIKTKTTAKITKRLLAGTVIDGKVEYDWDNEGIVRDTNVSIIIENNMKVYGTMTVEDRAINDYRDGFKKVQRRILWAMYQEKMWATSHYNKGAEVVGNTMGRYHPHGDQSIYDALVTMANFKNSLIDSMGNWGNWTGDAAAAMRYTECRLSKLAQTIVLDEYNMAIVETVPNYDGKRTEPVTFVPNLPLLLVYGSSGIAVAVTTSIPSFTMESVSALVRAAMARTIKNGKETPVTAKDCVKLLEFNSHTGGYVTSDDAALTEFFSQPKGRVEWSCEHNWNEEGRFVEVTGIAPEWGYAGKVRKFETMPEVKQVSSFSDEEGLRLRIILKKMSVGETEEVRAKIEKEMTSAMTYRINLIERQAVTEDGITEVKARFFTCSIPEMLTMWIRWRVEQHQVALQADLDRNNEKLRRESLLNDAIDFLDQIFGFLRNKTKGFDKVDALAKLMKVTTEESREIWALAIGRFDRLSKDEQTRKITDLKDEIKLIKADLKSPYRATYEYIKAATGG